MANPTYLEDYVIFPYPPLLEVEETLETYSQVLKAMDGSEQRIAPRPTPRQGFNFSIFLNSIDEQAKLEAMLFGWQKHYWGLPIWPEKTLHTATITAGASSITVDTSYADYRDDTLAIIWKSITEYETVLISTVAAGSLSLTGTVQNTYTGSKFIMPCRLAQMVSVENATWLSQAQSRHDFMFLIVDNLLLNSYTPDTTYNDIEVLTEAGLLESGQNVESDGDLTVQDYRVGGFEYFSYSDYNVINRPRKRRFVTKEDFWNYRLHLHSLYGRQNVVWYPTFKPDLRHVVTIGSSDTTIEIANVGLVDNMGLNSLRTHLAFLLPDGTQIYREITDIQDSNGNEEVTIDSALGQEIAVGGCNISFLDKCRSASDKFSLRWLSSGEMESLVNFIVVKQ